MQLYYDDNSTNAELMEKFKVNELSPALVYAGVSRFEDILNEIEHDKIPTNTGRPFSVVWGSDNDVDTPSDFINSPSQPNFASSHPMGFVNPLEDLIKI